MEFIQEVCGAPESEPAIIALCVTLWRVSLAVNPRGPILVESYEVCWLLLWTYLSDTHEDLV